MAMEKRNVSRTLLKRMKLMIFTEVPDEELTEFFMQLSWYNDGAGVTQDEQMAALSKKFGLDLK
jgi:hypothetical protein